MAVIAVVHPTMDQLVGCVIGDVVVDLLRIIQQDPECCVSILSNLSSPPHIYAFDFEEIVTGKSFTNYSENRHFVVNSQGNVVTFHEHAFALFCILCWFIVLFMVCFVFYFYVDAN